MRSGTATSSLHGGHCPRWLFEKMTKLSRGIALAVVKEFDTNELLKRLSDPVWFQSLGCVIGFDFHSSGVTTTTLGALKEGLSGMEQDVGIFICGGKGATSKKTPAQIERWGQDLNFEPELVEDLTYASKTSARVDSSAIQDGFNLYHHNFIFNRRGEWVVVQQGMRPEVQKARRYHWISSGLHDFVEEPHSGIASEVKRQGLNLTASGSKENRDVSTDLVREKPEALIEGVELISSQTHSVRQGKLPGFTELEMKDKNFSSHPVTKEEFNPERLKDTLFTANSEQPQDFEQLLTVKGVGAKAVRALSLVAEIIYGAEPSYEDPARYSFAHGGKDGVPKPIDNETYEKTLEAMEQGIDKSGAKEKEKDQAKRRLIKVFS